MLSERCRVVSLVYLPRKEACSLLKGEAGIGADQSVMKYNIQYI